MSAAPVSARQLYFRLLSYVRPYSKVFGLAVLGMVAAAATEPLLPALIKPLLEGGSILSAGARAIVTGGWQSLPKVEMPGALLIGDTAGLLNVPKIKGTHQAIRSGMLAAEHLAQSLDSNGFVSTGRAADGSLLSSPFATRTPGVFAVGDVRSGSIKRVASSVGEGAAAVQALHQFLAPAD